MFALAPEFLRARLALKRVRGVVNIGSKVEVVKGAPSAKRVADDIEAAVEANQARSNK